MERGLKTSRDMGIVRPQRGNYSPSLIDRLPASALAKLDALEQIRGDLFATSLSHSQRVIDISSRVARAEEDLANLTKDRKENDPDLVAARSAAVRLRAEFDRLKPKSDESSQRAQQSGRLLARIKEWFDILPVGCLINEDSGAAALKAPAGRVDQVDRCRTEVLQIRADLRRVVTAPIPIAEAKRLAREHVAGLVERGAPDVFGLIESADVITYPRDPQAPLLVHGLIDVVGLMAWLHPEQLIGRLEEEIARRADDSAALSSQERADQRGALMISLLKAERAEEAAIEAAERGGVIVFRRDDADPRAVLGLSGTLPALRLFS
jgi:hypothetical protein